MLWWDAFSRHARQFQSSFECLQGWLQCTPGPVGKGCPMQQLAFWHNFGDPFLREFFLDLEKIWQQFSGKFVPSAKYCRNGGRMLHCCLSWYSNGFCYRIWVTRSHFRGDLGIAECVWFRVVGPPPPRLLEKGGDSILKSRREIGRREKW